MAPNPDETRYQEDEFVLTLAEAGIKCGRRDEIDENLRRLMSGTRDLERYVPEVWAWLPTRGKAYFDVKSNSARWADSRNGTVELRPLMLAMQSSTPTYFVWYDRRVDRANQRWLWATADTLVRSRMDGCCQSCFDTFKAGMIPPEKCPRRVFGPDASGDPYLLYRLSVLRPWSELVQPIQLDLFGAA